MIEKIEILQEQLEQLENKKHTKIQERDDLIKNSPEVRRYMRLNFEEKKLGREILKLKEKIKDETMINCHHAFVNTNDKGDQYCIKCGLSNKVTAFTDCLKMMEIYNHTKDNGIVVNIDYKCTKEVAKKICNYIVERYPYISDEELVHFVAVAIHNMQTKKKSHNIKYHRAKRLFLRPAFLQHSNML